MLFYMVGLAGDSLFQCFKSPWANFFLEFIKWQLESFIDDKNELLILITKSGHLHKRSSPDSLENRNIKFRFVNLFKIKKWKILVF